MRALIAQLLAPAICFGLFIVTCPLTTQAAAPTPPEQPKCCALTEEASHCAPAQHSDDASEHCCVTHDCGTVIAASSVAVLLPRADVPRIALDFLATIAKRVDRPPVPPPRIA
jgi:hypothetical protein